MAKGISGILTLIMICHDMESYHNIMITIPHLAKKLQRFANKARISVSYPVDKGIPWIINIDEILPEGDLPST
ncbi:hypothetical protein [Cylindrospermum sp. FACHB-282]|uniref:hypothetical protein n=1 Tax=Cylindrospermum sp. FACHB-282 TaxID=2692794 RepID=UPI001689A2AC|nr:hypothetical protein [Cylindrospermum sp. FACHB-282]MBD2387241.1 hypothetical protein [Cylindrospermum sp. FACHB-282]